MGVPGAALFAAGKTVDVINQRNNQDALQDYRDDSFKANKRAIVGSFLNSVNEIRVGTVQERTQIAAEIENITAEALNTRGAAAASAATAGVSGQSVGDVQLDIARAESAVNRRLNTLQDFREAAAALRIRDLELSTRNRILGALPPPFVQSSTFGDLLGIGTSALSGYNFGQTLGDAYRPDPDDGLGGTD